MLISCPEHRFPGPEKVNSRGGQLFAAPYMNQALDYSVAILDTQATLHGDSPYLRAPFYHFIYKTVSFNGSAGMSGLLFNFYQESMNSR